MFLLIWTLSSLFSFQTFSHFPISPFYADCHSGRGILFYHSWRIWHALNYIFLGSYVLKYFIELKSVNPKNSVFLSLYICHNFHLQIFPTSFVIVYLQVFFNIHISLNFWATTMLKRNFGKLILSTFIWLQFHRH